MQLNFAYEMEDLTINDLMEIDGGVKVFGLDVPPAVVQGYLGFCGGFIGAKATGASTAQSVGAGVVGAATTVGCYLVPNC